ncbi:MAG: LysM domain-containing protein [Phycisphaerales bacterium]
MDAAAVVEPKPAALKESVEVEAGAEPKVKEGFIVNRETKLALLIGFVAIVVVTVLVGEHFGKARNATAATTDLGTSTAAGPLTSGPKVDPITSTPVGTPSAPLTPAGNGLGATPGNTTTTPIQPVELTSTGTPVNNGGSTAGTANTANANQFIPAAGIDRTGTNLTGEIPGTHPTNTLGGGNGAGAGTTTEHEITTATPVSTGVEKMHPVLKGETLATIAQKYYGDKNLSKQLGTYNAKRLSANGSVREGVTLRVPPKDVLLGAAVLASGNTGRSDIAATDNTKTKASDKSKTDKTNPTAEKTVATNKGGPRTYTIKKGDTLSTIASKELGSAKRWEMLVAANPHLDENSLRPGMTIKIPASK